MIRTIPSANKREQEEGIEQRRLSGGDIYHQKLSVGIGSRGPANSKDNRQYKTKVNIQK